VTTQTMMLPPKVEDEIRDANLGLIAAAGRMLDEAARVKQYRDRLLAAINQRQDREKAANGH